MNYQKVLEKKKERLAKFTGRKLKLKTAAYERAVARYTGKPIVAKRAEPAGGPVFPRPGSGGATGEKESLFRVSLPERGGIAVYSGHEVRAKTEKEARAKVRELLGLRALPPGTVVEKA